MQYLDLSLLVDRHMRKVEDNSILDVRAFSEELYNTMSNEQREHVDLQRLTSRVLQMAAYRFHALRW